MLIGERKELSDSLRLDFTHGLQQPLDNSAQHLTRFQIERGSCETGVAAVEQRGAQQLKSVRRPAHQVADDRLDRRIASKGSQVVQVMLNRNGCTLWFHRRRAFYPEHPGGPSRRAFWWC